MKIMNNLFHKIILLNNLIILFMGFKRGNNRFMMILLNHKMKFKKLQSLNKVNMILMNINFLKHNYYEMLLNHIINHIIFKILIFIYIYILNYYIFLYN
jgi:hypothetical protein